MLARLTRLTSARRNPRPVALALVLTAAAIFGGLASAATGAQKDDAATAPIPPIAAPLADAAPTAAPPGDPATTATEQTQAAQPEAPPPVNPELKARLDGSGAAIVAGQRIRLELLRRFYAARNYDTVWDKHADAVKALLAAIGRADEHGIDPNLFHAAFLQQRGASLTPLDRELLVSDAVLGFADALARGAVPVEERPRTEALTPGPIDLVAVVDKVLAAPDPGQELEALAPQTPEYAAVQRAYAAARAPTQSQPHYGRRTPAQGSDYQRRQLAVALERLRWLPRHLPATRLWVNTEDAHLDFYRDGNRVFSTRVVVGEVDKQTPEFETHTPTVLFNPPWYVPRSIAAKEIMPKLAYNPGYLAQHHMSWHGGTIRQDAGPYSALGRIKFEMPDPFDVYLHDTPSRGIFASADRRRSHGCVRVENPVRLASLLLNEDEAMVSRGVEAGYTHQQRLAKPVPVFIVYQTVSVDPSGRVQFLPDHYGRDALIWSLLNRSSEPAVEQIALNRPRS